MTVKEFLEKTPFKTLYTVRPWVCCADGFCMSIQASEFHYCTPRVNVSDNGYTEVELGYPSSIEEDILQYAEDPDDTTETVYGYVPIDIVEKIVAKHGGLHEILMNKKIEVWGSMIEKE